MAMRSTNSPRKLYKRAGSIVLCLSGCYFGPRVGEKCLIDASKEVYHTVLKPAAGKKRIEVEQIAAGGASIVETWTQKALTFKKRAPKGEGIGDQLPPAPEAAAS